MGRVKFPGAPAGSWVSDEGWLICGDEAFTEEEWRAFLAPRRGEQWDAGRQSAAPRGGCGMTDVKILLEEATPLPWIRPWATLEVHAPGADDLFGCRLTPYSLQQYRRRAQSNLDLAVHAVNSLPAYEAAVSALERIVGDWPDDIDPYLQPAREALRRLRAEAA